MKQQRGYTILLAMATLVIVAILAETVHVSSQYRVKRDKEAELLFRGQAYLRAIDSYYRAKPDIQTYPKQLEDLLNDPRFANKRHIRKLYKDPLTGDDWRLLRGMDDGIVGVASTSDETPLKQTDFPAPIQAFEGRTRYSEWAFEHQPPNPTLPTPADRVE
ncbi:MAG: type II secretion system protein [Thiohalophilus sp.]